VPTEIQYTPRNPVLRRTHQSNSSDLHTAHTSRRRGSKNGCGHNDPSSITDGLAVIYRRDHHPWSASLSDACRMSDIDSAPVKLITQTGPVRNGSMTHSPAIVSVGTLNCHKLSCANMLRSKTC